MNHLSLFQLPFPRFIRSGQAAWIMRRLGLLSGLPAHRRVQTLRVPRLAGLATGLILYWLITTAAQAQTCGNVTFTTDRIASAAIVPARSGTPTGLLKPSGVNTISNVTNADITDAAQLVLGLVLASEDISTQVSSVTLPAGATAGYVIQRSGLSLGVGQSITIHTYLDGTPQDQGTVNTLLDLPLLGSGKTFVGIPTTKPFNEIQLTVSALVSASTINVYYPLAVYTGSMTTVNPTTAAASDGSVSVSLAGINVAGNVPVTYTWNTGGSTSALTGLTTGTYSVTVSRTGAGCLYTGVKDIGALACGTTPLTTAYSSGVTVSTATVGGDVRTGIYGAACVGCGVTNTANVVDASLTNAAQVYVVAGILAGGRVSVLDTRRTYPAGIQAGYVVQDGGLLGTALFNGTTIRTYLDGVLQETANVTGLLDLPLLTTGYSSIGFTTTKSFNEVQLDASSVVGALINVNVAYAFVRPADVTLATSTTAATNGTNGAINLTVSGGVSPYSYAWSNGATTQAISGLAAGIYSVTVTGGNGCTGTTSATVLTAAPSFSFTCATASVSGTFTANGTGGQTGILTLPIVNATAGVASLSIVSGSDFISSPSPYTALVTAGQTSLSIPVLYDGMGLPGVRIVSVVSANATGSCSPTATILTSVIPPVVAIVSPLNNSTISASPEPVITGTATPGADILLKSPTNANLCSTTASLAGTWFCAVGLPTGLQTLTAIATNSGGSAAAQATVTVVSLLSVTGSPATLTALSGQPRSGSAVNALNPGGGTLPYLYSVFSPASGSAASGLTTNTAHGGVTINAIDGTYLYTSTPGYSGTDVIGINVCDSGTPQQCQSALIPVTVTPAQGVGTLDCLTLQLSGIQAGTASDGVLKMTVVVATGGQFPISLSGSGLSLSQSPYALILSTTGVHVVYIPIRYDGSAFGPALLTVTGAGVCSPNLTGLAPRVVSSPVLNLGSTCTPPSAAILSK